MTRLQIRKTFTRIGLALWAIASLLWLAAFVEAGVLPIWQFVITILMSGLLFLACWAVGWVVSAFFPD